MDIATNIPVTGFVLQGHLLWFLIKSVLLTENALICS